MGEPKAVSMVRGEYLIGKSKTVAIAAGRNTVDCLVCGEGICSIVMLCDSYCCTSVLWAEWAILM